MCLVFRILLLSLNWWVVSVVAQGVTSQDDPTPSAQVDPAAQAQPPQDDTTQKDQKVEEAKTEVVPPVDAIQKEDKKVEDTKVEEKKPEEATAEVVPPVDATKKEDEKIKDVKKDVKEEEKRPEEAKQQVAPPAEEVKKEDEPKDVDSEELEIKGIDTVDLDDPRGNWLFKKIWWGRAENKYEKIRAIFENVLESRIIFFTKRSTADKDLFAPFYFEIGMSNGELQGIVSELKNYIEKERRQEADLSTAGREVLNLLLSEKKSIESINSAVLAVNKLDQDIDETLKKLMEQINLARKYEQEAWRNFKEIGRVLNDKKARELFYQMDTAYNNIKDVQEYISQALAVHLDRVVSGAKNQTERIKSTIDILKKKGHDLKTLADKASGKIQPKPTSAEQEGDEEDGESEEELGFFTRIFSAIQSGFVTVWDSIAYVVTLPFSLFSPAESDEQDEIEQESISVSEDEEKS